VADQNAYVLSLLVMPLGRIHVRAAARLHDFTGSWLSSMRTWRVGAWNDSDVEPGWERWNDTLHPLAYPPPPPMPPRFTFARLRILPVNPPSASAVASPSDDCVDGCIRMSMIRVLRDRADV
jgi:hypothetical protein